MSAPQDLVDQLLDYVRSRGNSSNDEAKIAIGDPSYPPVLNPTLSGRVVPGSFNRGGALGSDSGGDKVFEALLKGVADYLYDLYEESANKGTANGYAGLDSSGKVPTAQLGGAGADATKFLRGDQNWVAVTGSGSVPTGTGFRHVTSGVEDGATSLVKNADVSATAAISESKLGLNFPTHSNANDPSSGEKAALAGTNGTPGSGNKFVTNSDPRLTAGTTPTGTGWRHVTGGVEDSASSTPTAAQVGAEASGAVATHAALTTGVHGVGASTVESVAGSTSKVSTHAALTANVHGFDASGKAPPQAHASSHVTGGSDVIATAVAGGNAGLLSGADKSKLDGIAAGAVSDHVNLANKGTNTHATIDSFIASKATASGLASLDGGSKVVQEPASKAVAGGIASLDASTRLVQDANTVWDGVGSRSASDTSTANTIPVANSSGKLDTWVSDATAAIKGKVQLAGQLGGTAASPDVRGMRETSGPTLLTLGAVADGQFLKRVGAAVVGAAAGGGSTPTGTGFAHITGGVQDSAAKLVSYADTDGTLATITGSYVTQPTWLLVTGDFSGSSIPGRVWVTGSLIGFSDESGIDHNILKDDDINYTVAALVGGYVPASQLAASTYGSANGIHYMRGDRQWALPLLSIAPSSSVLIPAGYGAYVPDEYECVSGVQTEIGAGAVMEIG